MKPCRRPQCSALIAFGVLVLARTLTAAETVPGSLEFDRDVKPVFENHCFGCHADGENEGSMSFDELLALDDRERSNEKWHRVLRQLQSGLMPPPGEDRPSTDQVAIVENWIKYRAFELDPDNPDPGRVTVRRLNQVEYRNSIRDLIGVDYDTSANFPADDTGHGFDNIGDVLSLSPLLLEKYVNAAKEIVSSAVPMSQSKDEFTLFANGCEWLRRRKPSIEQHHEIPVDSSFRYLMHRVASPRPRPRRAYPAAAASAAKQQRRLLQAEPGLETHGRRS